MYTCEDKYAFIGPKWNLSFMIPFYGRKHLVTIEEPFSRMRRLVTEIDESSRRLVLGGFWNEEEAEVRMHN